MNAERKRQPVDRSRCAETTHWYDRLQQQPDDEDFSEPKLPPKGKPFRVRIRPATPEPRHD